MKIQLPVPLAQITLNEPLPPTLRLEVGDFSVNTLNIVVNITIENLYE
jgi:hypothetical protein